MSEIDDPKMIDTYEKIIKNLKEDLITYIKEPNDQTASVLYASMGSIPFKYKSYEICEDYIYECREYMSMLFQLFAGYFQEFIKKGIEYDKQAKEGEVKK